MDQTSGLFMLAGLIVVILGAKWLGSTLPETVTLFTSYVGGIALKHGASMWGNSKEHQAAPGATVQPVKPV